MRQSHRGHSHACAEFNREQRRQKTADAEPDDTGRGTREDSNYKQRDAEQRPKSLHARCNKPGTGLLVLRRLL